MYSPLDTISLSPSWCTRLGGLPVLILHGIVLVLALPVWPHAESECRPFSVFWGIHDIRGAFVTVLAVPKVSHWSLPVSRIWANFPTQRLSGVPWKYAWGLWHGASYSQSKWPAVLGLVMNISGACNYQPLSLDWTIRELALYDFPALIEYIRDATGYDKVRVFH